MTAPPPNRRDTRWQHALAGALMAGGPLWHYLYVNRYPFDRPEALLMPAALAMLGAGLSLLALRGSPLVRYFVFTLLLGWFIDLQFDLERLRFAWIVALAAPVAAALIGRRALVASTALSALYLSSLPRGSTDPVRAPGPEAPAGTAPPLLLHLVLDGQWGVGGMRAAGDSATAQFVADFYGRRGFSVHEGAYSRSSVTRRSMGSELSLGDMPRVRQLGQNEYRLTANPYFSLLRARGYDIRVYQSSHLDYCHPADAVVSWCQTASANAIANIGYLDAPLPTRAALAGRYFLNMTSHLYRRVKPRRDGAQWRRSYAGRGLVQAQAVRNDIATRGAAGSAYFVHLLLPHAPFEVDAACHAYPDLGRRLSDLNYDAHRDPDWSTRLAQYGDAVRCIHARVAAIIDAVDSAAGHDRSIIIVQGDHGSRMHPMRIPWDRLSRYSAGQLNAFYSTLLAVRAPSQDARSDSGPVPVQDFLWMFARAGLRDTLAGFRQHFVISTPDGGQTSDTIRFLAPGDMIWSDAASGAGRRRRPHGDSLRGTF